MSALFSFARGKEKLSSHTSNASSPRDGNEGVITLRLNFKFHEPGTITNYCAFDLFGLMNTKITFMNFLIFFSDDSPDRANTLVYWFSFP